MSETLVPPINLPDSRPQNLSNALELGLACIKNYVRQAPTASGVYRMLNEKGDVLYVGKAKNIQKRIISYTQANRLTNRHIRMVASTCEMVFITTRTEAEALLLEASLIKRFKPPYNVLLKDDKSFPYILLREDHAWAQITKHRGARQLKGRYYGPFASINSVNRTLNTLQKIFQLRSCSDSMFASRTRPCLLYQIKRCSGPCVDRISPADYQKSIGEAADFLEGRTSHIQKDFAERMQDASKQLDFEKAALYRDRLKALTHVQSQQSLTNGLIEEADVIAATEIGGQIALQIFFYRAGQNWGNRAYFPRHSEEDSLESVMSNFLAQFYDNKPAPKLILLSHSLPDQALMSEAFSAQMGYKVTIAKPERGKKMDLINEAARNAQEALERRLSEKASQKQLLEGLQKLFNLPSPPRRIEVYDNSHIQGSHALGAMIVAGPDGFIKNSYRQYNMKDAPFAAGDDFAMMRAVMERRFSRLQKEDADKSGGLWPDLLLIDGGKGQLSAVSETLERLGITGVAYVAISKGPDRHAGREEFHQPNKPSFRLKENDPVLYYLQRLRDEAHRFAITNHRAKRSKAIHKSPLDEIAGIGPKRKRALLHHFGSAKAVMGADIKDLMKVDGINAAIAETIYGFFQDPHSPR